MIDIFLKELERRMSKWVASHYIGISIFNVAVILLFTLRSAGYFHPFFPISIDLAVMISLFLSIFLLGARSTAFFLIAFTFFLIAAFFKLVKIDVWAERTSVYVFEALLLGVVVLFVDIVRNKDV